MKMRPEHLEYLRVKIAPLDTGTMREASKCRRHSNTRYAWDLLYKAGLSGWICANLYPYLNDDHIDTALRALVPPLYPPET
jgi:hypothetical protein